MCDQNITDLIPAEVMDHVILPYVPTGTLYHLIKEEKYRKMLNKRIKKSPFDTIECSIEYMNKGLLTLILDTNRLDFDKCYKFATSMSVEHILWLFRRVGSLKSLKNNVDRNKLKIILLSDEFHEITRKYNIDCVLQDISYSGRDLMIFYKRVMEKCCDIEPIARSILEIEDDLLKVLIIHCVEKHLPVGQLVEVMREEHLGLIFDVMGSLHRRGTLLYHLVSMVCEIMPDITGLENRELYEKIIGDTIFYYIFRLREYGKSAIKTEGPTKPSRTLPDYKGTIPLRPRRSKAAKNQKDAESGKRVIDVISINGSPGLYRVLGGEIDGIILRQMSNGDVIAVSMEVNGVRTPLTVPDKIRAIKNGLLVEEPG